jgi:ribonuclease VapC
MAINIKNKEAERLLAEIKQRTGMGASEIVLELLRSEHAKLELDKQRRVAEALERMRHWQATVAAATRPDAPPVDMIVVDSSAYFAITLGEPDAPKFMTALALADSLLMSAATYVECALVTIARTGPPMIDRWLKPEGVDVVAVDIMQARLAADAFTHFGRGRHPARLNYDDCFAYALAKSKNAPLLYEGTDFDQTDLRSALASRA